MTSELDTHFGAPELPRPEQVDYWRALGGCLSANAVPEAEIPWSGVTEISANNWTLRFDLAEKVTVESDRGRSRNDASLEITLHGPAPALFQERVRQTLVKFVDPAGRIQLPKLHRSWGD